MRNKEKFIKIHRNELYEQVWKIPLSRLAPKYGLSDVGLLDFLNQIAHLNMQYHQQLILASYNYTRALKEFGIDEEMVFIRLVSAVEAVSEWAGLQEGDDLFDGKEFDEIVKFNLLSRAELGELKKLFEVRNAKLKFKRFIEQYS